ncbi:Eukaryotic translation initiation factor 3 subunit J-B [Bagarius yarrelli]|uniref:Eukaryotic translation initiation factor 3 subunit J n=1 Tax=Bagarius yarrelli TaxID=175774 RepID=A0A556V3I0_BAGYA|nr:Eukaryotic translation initiation factor 3 subunit J-B [Bagarius yarrelli]
MAMSALVKEQVEGITPLTISLISAKKFAVVFNQAQISAFSYEQAAAVTAAQRSALSSVQQTALSMVLNPFEDKPVDFRDADNFEPNEPLKKAAGLRDRWEGEDEEDDVKDNWDDEEEEQKVEEQKTVPAKKKLGSKSREKEIKEKEIEKEKKQEELRIRLQESQADSQLSPEEQVAEKLRLQKLQEESDMALACEAFGVDGTTTNSASGIEAMCPSTKEDFVVFEKLLRDKITQFEKSVHYSSFLESLFRELCLSLEVDDLKKINNSLSVLLTERQKQEKEKTKGTKKKKKTILAGGGLKAKMKDDFDAYGDFEGGYNDYEDFM